MKHRPPSAERELFGVIAAVLLAVAPTVAEPVEITVQSTAQLIEALASGPGTRRVRLGVGRYVLDAPLVVPDRVELSGEGVMRSDPDGLPAGFESPWGIAAGVGRPNRVRGPAGRSSLDR
jgi:hypothetical protein